MPVNSAWLSILSVRTILLALLFAVTYCAGRADRRRWNFLSCPQFFEVADTIGIDISAIQRSDRLNVFQLSIMSISRATRGGAMLMFPVNPGEGQPCV
jgi:hypothetical protein